MGRSLRESWQATVGSPIACTAPGSINTTEVRGENAPQARLTQERALVVPGDRSEHLYTYMTLSQTSQDGVKQYFSCRGIPLGFDV